MLNSERFIHAIQRESGADEEEEMYLRCGSGVPSLYSVPIRNDVGGRENNRFLYISV